MICQEVFPKKSNFFNRVCEPKKETPDGLSIQTIGCQKISLFAGLVLKIKNGRLGPNKSCLIKFAVSFPDKQALCR